MAKDGSWHSWVAHDGPLAISHDASGVRLDEWTYDLGPQRFVRYVYFENSRVVSTATGRRGTKS